MTDPTNVNPQILDSINATQQAVLSPPVVKTSGAGKAYHSVAQSTAFAVQDAVDQMRNLNTISTTAIGVAMSQFLATGDPQYMDAIQQAQKVVEAGAENLKTIGQNAASVLKEFPSG